jgi:NADPH2:quinone reductase
MPDPGPNEVRLRVETCALNRKDVFARVGHPDRADTFPKRTGSDIAGVVDAVGDDVTDWDPGDRVNVYPRISCGDCEYCLNGEQTMCGGGTPVEGGLAEFVTVPATVLEPIPDDVTFETAAAWPITFTTAWRMMVTAGELNAAESALVLGASGGVGNAALQIANLVGATTYATTSTHEKAEILEQWADEVITYTDTDFRGRVMELTDERGVDLVADHVGQATWQDSIDCLVSGGRMVICGATSGATPDVDIRSVYQHHRQIIGAPLGNRQDFRDVGELIARGSLDPQIHTVLGLDEVATGHELLENRVFVGKILVDVGG